MTYQDVIDLHYQNINKAKDLIKKDIKTFFEENKEKRNIVSLIKVKFADKMDEYCRTYTMTAPTILYDTPFEKVSLVNSLTAQLDLHQYPLELYRDMLEKNPQNLSIEDEIL